MDPVNPWLDPSEVRHLAEQLLRPVAPVRLSAADHGFDESFVGFTSGGVVHVVPEEKMTVELPPVSAVPVSPPTPEPPPGPPSHILFLQRIHIFRDWLGKNFQATDIFILDREGKVIFDESGHGRLHFMARNLAIASRGSGNIHVKIGPAAILELIPCETPYGQIVLGALVPNALPVGQVQTITESLIQTASPA